MYKEQLINVKKKKKKMMTMMITKIEITVSQQFSFSRTPFGFEKNHESSHHCSCKYPVSGREVSKIKKFYLKTDIK